MENQGQENQESNNQQGQENAGGGENNSQAIPTPIAETLQALKGIVNEEVLEQIAGGKKEAAAGGEKPKKVVEKKEATNEDNSGEDKGKKGEGDDKGAGWEEKPKKVAEKKEVDKPGIFGLNKNKNADPIVIEKFEDAINHINKDFGMALKDAKDMPKFFESSKKWRADSQKLSEVEKVNENLTKILEGLPQEMIDGIKDFYEKGDYSEALSKKPKFDYKQDVDKVDTKKLVDAYFPGKFAEDDFKEETLPPALEIAISAAKDKYVSEKKAKEEKLTRMNQEASQKVIARKESIKSSVEVLMQKFPDMDKAAVKQVEKVLETGDVTSLFFTKNGTYDKSAASRIAVALFTDDILSEAMGAAANQAESRNNEEILTRGADKKNPVKNNGGGSEIPEHVQKQIKEITNLGTKKNTF